MNNYAEIKNDYICEDVDIFEGEILAYCTIDAWETDDDSESGSVVAKVFLTTGGEVVVDIIDRVCLVRGAKPYIEEAKEKMLKYWNNYRDQYQAVSVASECGLILDDQLIALINRCYQIYMGKDESSFMTPEELVRLDKIPEEYLKKEDIPEAMQILGRGKHDLICYNKFAGKLDLLCPERSSKKESSWVMDTKEVSYFVPLSKMELPHRAVYKNADEMIQEFQEYLSNIGVPGSLNLYDRLVHLDAEFRKDSMVTFPVCELGLMITDENRRFVKSDTYTKRIIRGRYYSAFPDKCDDPIMITQTIEPITFVPLDKDPNYLYSAYTGLDEIKREIYRKVLYPDGYDFMNQLCWFVGVAN